jgi:hypothetical protein
VRGTHEHDNATSTLEREWAPPANSVVLRVEADETLASLGFCSLNLVR